MVSSLKNDIKYFCITRMFAVIHHQRKHFKIIKTSSSYNIASSCILRNIEQSDNIPFEIISIV
jgi:hypothetical protein